ncbi:hypothetical protein KUTeg_008629 [Tegillarca granosa]|uniref:C2H2-type domain-containing protein n=1 Tax=Tegillarca granosa TaxID=220873 RepID=A0ABQ9FEH0_TEGGR|nr:hypothetical protein KUTeg_008629 [Tegillarca granosa]
MAFNFGHNQRGNSRNQNPRFSSRQPGPPNQSQPFFGSPQDFLANLSSFFRPRNAPTGLRNQFNSGNQFGQNDFSFNSGFQNERPPNRPFNSDFHPRFTASKPQNEHQRKPYQSDNQDFGETNSYHPYRKESQNVQSKTEFTKRNEDNLRINEVGKEKFSEIKDDKLKIGQESDLKVDNESVDQDLCDLNDIDMEIDDEDGDTDIGNIDVSDVSMSQQVEHKEKKIDKPDEKKADLPKNTLESQRQDKKDVNIQGKINPAESPKTLEKNKDKNIQGKGTTESSKENVVIAAKKDEKKEEEEEDSDSEDTGYCDYCKMEFATADAYWKHTRGLLHTQKLMGADTSVSRSPQNTKKTSKPQEPATSTYVPKKGELVTAAVIEANITETPTDLYESFPENKKLELSKPDIESQYKSVSGNQKSEQFKNVSGSKNLETGKPKIESQYYGEEPQSKSDSFDSYKGYSHGNDNGDDYEDLNEVGTKQENWMDVDPSEMQKVPAKERDLAPGDLGKNPFPDEFYCHLCDARCTGAVTYRMHLDGRTHKMKVIMTNRGDRAKAMKLKSMMTGSRKVITVNKEPKINKLLAECGSPLIGLQYVSEYHRDDEKAVRYVCNLCESKCDGASIISHVMGSRHRMKYFQEHHEDIYSHLMQYSSTRKKSDLNASAEMFARDLERKEGRGEVKVKMEIAPSTEKAAIQLIKTAAVQIPELLSLTGTEKSELKTDSKSKQRETEGYSDYSSGYSYHSTSSLNQRGGKSGARDGNHGYYNRANADSYEDTGSYYESFDYGHGQRGSKRSLEPDSRARGILKSGRIGSKSYTGSSGSKTGAYGGSEEWYDDSYGYGYDENYGYGTGDYSGYGGEGSYRKHKSVLWTVRFL